MKAFIKFFFIFNRNLLIPFHLALYGLLLFFFRFVTARNKSLLVPFLILIAVIFIIKAVYEAVIFGRETGYLRSLGLNTFIFFLFRVMEKTIYVLLALVLVSLSGLLSGTKTIPAAELLTPAFYLLVADTAVMMFYSVFHFATDISRLLNQR